MTAPSTPEELAEELAEELELHRLLLILQPVLDRLQPIWPHPLILEDRDDAIELLYQLQSTHPQPQLFLYYNCLHCGKADCDAWVKIYCGACRRQWWVFQQRLRAPWCPRCSFSWHGYDWQKAIKNYTGCDNVRETVSLIQDLDQRVRLELVFSIEREVCRLLAQTNTRVLQTICKHGVGIPQMHQVDPADWDACCRKWAHRATRNRRQAKHVDHLG